MLSLVYLHLALHSFINLWHTCATRITVVAMCVCVPVKSHLTSGASVHPENSATYSLGNEGQKICGIFSKTVLFQSYGTPALYGYRAVSHFLLAEYVHALLKCHVDWGRVWSRSISFATFRPLTFTM